MSTRKILMGMVSAAVCAGAVSSPACAQSAGSLYLRGDAGWSGSVDANIHDRNFPVDQVITDANGNAGRLNDIHSGWLVGIGGGMWFTPTIRGEVVYTYRGDYHLDELDQDTPPNLFNAGITSNSVMGNVYVDIPAGIPGVLPFVGLGLGWANVSVGNLSGSGTLTATPFAVPLLTATAVAPGGTQDNIAWQVMTGVSVPVSRDVMVDFFYRYFDAGHMRSGSGDVTVDGIVVRTYSGLEGALHAHELGASLRISLGPY